MKNLGKELNATEISQQFETVVKNDSGDKIEVRCRRDLDGDRNNMITELWINLEGEIEADTSMNQLLENAPDAD